MKRMYHILILILFLITLSVIRGNTVYAQENPRNTNQETVIELTRGCRLVLDANINTQDTLLVQIIKGIRNIVTRVQSLIPLDSITIDLAIDRSQVLPFLGVGGRTIGDDTGITVAYFFDPRNPNFKIEFMINGLVHEFHHASRLSMPDWKFTLLELMVSEGLADRFLVEVTRCEPPQWSRALTEEELNKYLLKVKPVLRIVHESWDEKFNEKYFVPWMFGRTGDDPIPGWTGYSLGWQIVENYLKAHPEARASLLVFTSAEEIAASTPELNISK